MHSEIEKLIKIAFSNGDLSNKELEIIQNKASKLGVDNHELELYIENQRDILRNQRKCPNCGSMIPGLSQTCEYCEYILQHPDSEISAESLLHDIENNLQELKKLPEPDVKMLFIKYSLYVFATLAALSMLLNRTFLSSYYLSGLFLLFGAIALLSAILSQKQKFNLKLFDMNFKMLLINFEKNNRMLEIYYANNTRIKKIANAFENKVEQLKAERKQSVKRLTIIYSVIVAVFIGILVIDFSLEEQKKAKQAEERIFNDTTLVLSPVAVELTGVLKDHISIPKQNCKLVLKNGSETFIENNKPFVSINFQGVKININQGVKKDEKQYYNLRLRLADTSDVIIDFPEFTRTRDINLTNALFSGTGTIFLQFNGRIYFPEEYNELRDNINRLKKHEQIKFFINSEYVK